jgi:hypothetical protein
MSTLIYLSLWQVIWLCPPCKTCLRIWSCGLMIMRAGRCRSWVILSGYCVGDAARAASLSSLHLDRRHSGGLPAAAVNSTTAEAALGSPKCSSLWLVLPFTESVGHIGPNRDRTEFLLPRIPRLPIFAMTDRVLFSVNRTECPTLTISPTPTWRAHPLRPQLAFILPLPPPPPPYALPYTPLPCLSFLPCQWRHAGYVDCAPTAWAATTLSSGCSDSICESGEKFERRSRSLDRDRGSKMDRSITVTMVLNSFILAIFSFLVLELRNETRRSCTGLEVEGSLRW